MCGIAGIFIKDPQVVKKHIALETMANLLLLGIESRGKKATGFVTHLPGGSELTLDKKAVAASDFIKDRSPIPEGATVWLGHTRLDTRGSPEKNENNHPVVCANTFLTHNGTIYNDDDLFKEHKRERLAEVDSEALAMLIDEYGFKEAAKGLAQVRGAFAIASINPEKHPDEVLLAKGGWAPLVIHESDKFVLWASERNAIRDAWKVVLGTPPAYSSFKELHEGEIAVVTKNGIEYRKFERPEDFRVRRGRGTTGQRGNSGATRRGPTTVYRPTTKPREEGRNRSAERRLPPTRLSPGRHVEEVGAVRTAGRGTARLFEEYELGNYDLALFQNADYPYQWDWCDGCLTCVLLDDMRDTVNWGFICDDCYDVQIEKFGYKDPTDPAGFLSDEELTQLDNWAKIETEVHRLALDAVHEATGMDTETVDFLIFRVQEEYFEGKEDMKQLAEDLDELYQEAAGKQWVSFGLADATILRSAPSCESDSGVAASISPGEKPLGLIAGAVRPPRTSLQNPDAISHCTTHQRTFPASQECHECIRDFSRSTQPDLTLDQCLTCTRRQRPRFHMLKWAWCRKHYTTCSGCNAGLVAIATDPDGRRLCHFCCRGQKGLLYDGKDGQELAKRGIEVAERTSK